MIGWIKARLRGPAFSRRSPDLLKRDASLSPGFGIYGGGILALLYRTTPLFLSSQTRALMHAARSFRLRPTTAAAAFGGVAATPKRALDVEAALLGKPLDADAVETARAALAQAFSPLSDHRASADYRRALCGNLFAKFARERLGVEGVA